MIGYWFGAFDEQHCVKDGKSSASRRQIPNIINDDSSVTEVTM